MCRSSLSSWISDSNVAGLGAAIDLLLSQKLILYSLNVGIFLQNWGKLIHL